MKCQTSFWSHKSRKKTGSSVAAERMLTSPRASKTLESNPETEEAIERSVKDLVPEIVLTGAFRAMDWAKGELKLTVERDGEGQKLDRGEEKARVWGEMSAMEP